MTTHYFQARRLSCSSFRFASISRWVKSLSGEWEREVEAHSSLKAEGKFLTCYEPMWFPCSASTFIFLPTLRMLEGFIIMSATIVCCTNRRQERTETCLCSNENVVATTVRERVLPAVDSACPACPPPNRKTNRPVV